MNHAIDHENLHCITCASSEAVPKSIYFKHILSFFFIFYFFFIGSNKEGQWSNSYGSSLPKSRKHSWRGIIDYCAFQSYEGSFQKSFCLLYPAASIIWALNSCYCYLRFL